MRKQNRLRVVLAVVTLAATFLATHTVMAGSTLPWINSSLSIQKQADTQSLPDTVGSNGNIDCYRINEAICSVQTGYGQVGSGAVMMDYGNRFYPVVSYVNNTADNIFPIPNSTTAITVTNDLPYDGPHLYFNYNFSSIVELLVSPVNNKKSFIMQRPPDARLEDLSHHRLATDLVSASFSQNGQWMVVSDPNVAMLRINLRTFEVLPFAPGFTYTSGYKPQVKTAITDDGRYAVVGVYGSTGFTIYDLNTCEAPPPAITNEVKCQWRDAGSYLKQQFPTFTATDSLRFMDDRTLAVYANYMVGVQRHTARFIIRAGNNSDYQQDYLALGDSYISGEGAFDYVGATDTATNKCHLSLLAYPYLIGHDLNYDSYHSVACAGATTDDLINTSPFYVGQANKSSDQASRAVLDKTGQTDQYLASFTPGYIDQLDFAKTYQPKVITVSVGGNDMGFSSILYSCVAPWKTGTCYNTYESRLELVNLINTTVFNNLVQTYDALKNAGSPDMRIYVVGYPQIAKPDGNCGLNVHLNNDEIKFSQLLIDYLDTVIQQAAAKTGVYYVDTQDALNGHRLCEAGPGSVAMNGFTVGKDRPASFGPIGDESYHPNPTGYQLMENKVLSATNNLTKTMSAPNLNAAPPAIDGQPILDVPHDDSTIKTVQYDPSITADLAYAGATTDISINGPSEGLSSYSPLQAELHSTPIDLGNYTTNADGDLNAQITIPSDTPAGYHTLHFYGTNIADQPVDIYKFIYIAASAEDMDGDGMPDDQQACIGVTSSGQDYDQDGIDDACDADISLPPLVSTAAVQTSSAKPTSQPQPLPVLASNPPGPDASYQSGDPDPGQPTQSQPVTLAEHTTAPVAAMPNSKPSTKPGNAKYFVIAGAIIFLLAIATALKWLV